MDAGDCGACLNEVKQLNNPYYNMHRLGFFITPTPRHADVLLVVGPVTDQMRFALKKIHDAMPTPKRVVAVGACALSGGVFAKSFVCANGVADVLPVDVEVPGQSAAAAGHPARLAGGGRTQAAACALGRVRSRRRRSAEWTRPTLLIVFFAACGAGILLSLVVRPAHQGIVLAWLGSLAAVAAVAAGAEVLLTGEIFTRPLWALPGLTTLTLRLDPLSAAFVLVAGLVLLPASIYAGGELRRESFRCHERAFTVLLLRAVCIGRSHPDRGRCAAVSAGLGGHVDPVLSARGDNPGTENGQVGSAYLLLAMGEAGTLAAALGFLLLALGARLAGIRRAQIGCIGTGRGRPLGESFSLRSSGLA